MRAKLRSSTLLRSKAVLDRDTYFNNPKILLAIENAYIESDRIKPDEE